MGWSSAPGYRTLSVQGNRPSARSITNSKLLQVFHQLLHSLFTRSVADVTKYVHDTHLSSERLEKRDQFHVTPWAKCFCFLSITENCETFRLYFLLRRSWMKFKVETPGGAAKTRISRCLWSWFCDACFCTIKHARLCTNHSVGGVCLCVYVCD